jgi:hypothetical protein
MGLSENLSGKKETAESAGKNGSFLRFVHYAEADKNAFLLKRRNDAGALLKSGDYKSSFVALWDYPAEMTEKNASRDYRGSDLHFTVNRGSVEVRRIFNRRTVTAQCFPAGFEKPPIAVMRQSTAANFTSDYGKFSIEDSRICILFSSSVTEASPDKMYLTLNEISLRAGKQDNAMRVESGEKNRCMHYMIKPTPLLRKKNAGMENLVFSTDQRYIFPGLLIFEDDFHLKTAAFHYVRLMDTADRTDDIRTQEYVCLSVNHEEENM